MNHNVHTVWNEKRDIDLKKREMDKIRKFIDVSKEVLGETIQAIILFGSKSMGTDDIWSDYDFYIIAKKEFGWNEKFEIYKKLDFSVDIIFRTLSQVKEGIDSFCSIDIYALTFGRVVYGEELYEEKERISELINNKKIILRPELGKGVIEYGAKA
jgi:predicted nucleotidyltransferase